MCTAHGDDRGGVQGDLLRILRTSPACGLCIVGRGATGRVPFRLQLSGPTRHRSGILMLQLCPVQRMELKRYSTMSCYQTSSVVRIGQCMQFRIFASRRGMLGSVVGIREQLSCAPFVSLRWINFRPCCSHFVLSKYIYLLLRDFFIAGCGVRVVRYVSSVIRLSVGYAEWTSSVSAVSQPAKRDRSPWPGAAVGGMRMSV